MALPQPRATLVTAVVVLSAAAWPPAVAARGSANIAALQVALRAQRLYAGSVDGVDGPGTAAAVRRLQRRSRLDADGIVGPLTRRTLGRRGRPAFGSRVVGPGDRGWDVAALQFLLAWRGFPSGDDRRRFRSAHRGGAHSLPALGGPIRRRTRRACNAAFAGAGRAAGPGEAVLPGGRRARRPFRPARRPLSQRHRRPRRSRDSGARGRRRHGHLRRLGPRRLRQSGRHRPRNGVSSWYAHLSRVDITAGVAATTATQVGLVGATGNATGPHLHFEVRLRGAVTDPLAALR